MSVTSSVPVKRPCARSGELSHHTPGEANSPLLTRNDINESRPVSGLLMDSLIQAATCQPRASSCLRTGPGRSMLIVKEGNRRVAASQVSLEVSYPSKRRCT